MLEARELMLRRRFETMIAEFTETRDLLARLESNPATSRPTVSKDEAAKARQKDRDKSPAESADSRRTNRRRGSRAGGCAPQARRPKSPEQQLAAERVQAERVVAEHAAHGHETLEVAEAFDAHSSGVDQQSRRHRGAQEPAQRRHRRSASPDCGWPFPRLGDSTARAASRPGGSGKPPSASQAAALAQADTILVDMKQVLDRMLELETFNEVLDMLRSVIAAQEKMQRGDQGPAKTESPRSAGRGLKCTIQKCRSRGIRSPGHIRGVRG